MVTKDIEVFKGDTWDGLEIQAVVNGSKLPDATTAKIEIRKDGKTGLVVKTLVSGTDIVVSQETSYTKILINPFIVELIVGMYYYDLELTMEGRIKTYLGGTFTVIQDTTQHG